ncbi:MAG: phage tail tube protein [Janthinobacterium lividum]
MTDSSQTQIAYVKETTYGVTPASPTFKKFRTTNIPSLAPNNQFITSDEIRSDRNVPNVVASGQSVAFDLPIEFSYGSFDDLLQAFMGNTWTGNVLKNGTALTSFSFENKFVTNGGLRYDRAKGVMVNTMALSLSANGKATGSFGVMGQKSDSASAALASSTYADPATTDFFTANDNFAITLGGVGTISVMSVSLSGTNNLRMIPVVGSKYTDGMGLGRFEVTGSLQTYFKDSALYDAYLAAIAAGTYFALTLSFNDPVTGKYDILLPKVKLTSSSKPGGANNADVMASFDFSAVVDTTAGCAMQITRTPVTP